MNKKLILEALLSGIECAKYGIRSYAAEERIEAAIREVQAMPDAQPVAYQRTGAAACYGPAPVFEKHLMTFATHPAPADAPPATIASYDSVAAFDAGWRVCADWAMRHDLTADMHSSAYRKERAEALAKLPVSDDEQDAKRYRWLVANSAHNNNDFYSGAVQWMVSRAQGGMGQNFYGEKINAAIDAAMQSEKK